MLYNVDELDWYVRLFKCVEMEMFLKLIVYLLKCHMSLFKVVKHIEMPKAAPQKSMCHFQKLEMILKWNKQNNVRLPQKYQFLLIRHKIKC